MINDEEKLDGLVHSHAIARLRSYRSNLSYAIHVISKQWVPDEEAPDVQVHLDTLRQHLAENGLEEADSFLLRFGLTVPGSQRGIVPPLMVLNDSRGGFSGRRQKEAAGAITRLQEALAIGSYFFPALPQDSHAAIVKLDTICDTGTIPNSEVWLDSYRNLSDQHALQLGGRAVEILDNDREAIKDVGIEILQHLACFRQSPLPEEICVKLLRRGVIWPSSLYRDSGEVVACRILSLIEASAESPSLNHLLLAFAWTRADTTTRAMLQWENQSPSWAATLYAPPADYLPTAGWCLEEGEGRRELISQQCVRLIPADGETSDVVRCRIPARGKCPGCNNRLRWLFDFSKTGHEHFQGEFAAAPRMVLCCLNCACYQPIYARYFGDGAAELLSTVEASEYFAPLEIAECARRLEDVPCPPYACAEPFGLDDSSTLGGIPMWLQDADHPSCLECGRLMTFLAQHDNSPLGEEGIYYAFFCAACGVSAVSYQQT